MQTIDIRTLFAFLYWLRDRVTAKAAVLDPATFRPDLERERLTSRA